MSKIRVLIVDDAVVLRRLLAEELAADPALEVVGTAANGKIALAKVPQVEPDVVILDVEMPELDGLATLRALRAARPLLPVIMFSALTERGAEATLDALALGATAYFPKPAGTDGREASLRVLRDGLIPEIKAICGRIRSGSSGARPAPPLSAESRVPGPDVRRPPARSPARVDAIAIAASTGGPNALADVFGRFPTGLPVPIAIVQHMPPVFTRLLAERLSARSPVPVAEGATDAPLQPGRAWIAPGDFHMAVTGPATHARLRVHQEPPENSCRPAADVLFRSAAQVFGPHLLAVVLTGMGQDGLRGCEAVVAAGGRVIAQDEATSVVWGMPGFVARAGLAEKVLPLPQIAEEIVSRVLRPS
ncbi:protein-glutamate methylesterase/protein-glutamine glutaminase [Frigoriglobus tundricola]|uniref:Protein-glutamate methylesterase/protein-glutamine glutaminase n=1 Tax=Frigoriglobus tundricola TaxID=2774151 RepID=A0A6M5YJZ7_9BACT|nr:chemotaxis response regulator protein-glutamate methylesterase [Frigoriglobus tundricola]QJW93616.1 Chemotaxis response regulator protein-glutamate methylesterase CheB [Frigoriglobus tundricola]